MTPTQPMQPHDQTPVEPILRDFLAKTLVYSEEGFNYPDDASFLQEGIIDSLGVMELVEFVQKKFAIHLDQREVTPENFDSVAKLAAFVRRKRGAQAGDCGSPTQTEGI
jgi:acyl carrier protein